MNHSITERLIDYLRGIFFIEPALDLFFIFCFVTSIIYHYKSKEKLLFFAYFFSGVLFVPVRIVLFSSILTEKEDTILLECTNTVFELAEIIAFYYFFRRCLLSNGFKRILRWCFCCLLAIFTTFFIMLALPGYSIYDIRVHSQFVNVIEFFFLFGMCLGYYREVFTDIPVKTLFNRPSFLIVTSAFFYSILMIPFFLIASDIRIEELPVHNLLFACHYILLIILLFSILKGFLCKAPITT